MSDLSKCMQCDLHGKCPVVLYNKRCPYTDKKEDVRRWTTTGISLLALITSIIVLVMKLKQL